MVKPLNIKVNAILTVVITSLLSLFWRRYQSHINMPPWLQELKERMAPLPTYLPSILSQSIGGLTISCIDELINAEMRQLDLAAVLVPSVQRLDYVI